MNIMYSWLLKTSPPAHRGILGQFLKEKEPNYQISPAHQAVVNATAQRVQNKGQTLQRLDNRECMNAYRSSLLAGRSNVLAVTAATASNGSSLLDFLQNNPDGEGPTWICERSANRYRSDLDFGCTVDVAMERAEWRIRDQLIEYCLSEVVDEHCKLQFSKSIMIAVTLCNFIKLCCMLYVIFGRIEDPLVTTG